MSANLTMFDEMEWAPALAEEWEGEARFSFGGVPVEVVRLLRARREAEAIRRAIQLGDRSENHLSDLVFFSRHPERQGRAISRSESRYAALSREWLAIRDRLVRPALARGSSGAPSYPTVPPTVPTPAPTPGGSAAETAQCRSRTCRFANPAMTAAQLRAEIVRVANGEYARWGQGTVTETDPAIRAVLRDYWQTGVNIDPDRQFGGNWPTDIAWSAAFISWVVRTAGAGDSFCYSSAHGDYITWAKANRDQNTCSPFRLLRVSEAPVQPGDIACRSRGAPGTYETVRPGSGYHCDLVVAVGSGGTSVTTIGGNRSLTGGDPNLGLTVNRSTASWPGSYFAVIRIAEPETGSHSSSELESSGDEFEEWSATARPELEWEAEATFAFTGMPAAVVQLLRAGRERDAVVTAIRLGDRNENHLSDLIFFQRHPERGGRYIARAEPQYEQVSREWLQIRDVIVRPILQTSAAPSAPGTPATPILPSSAVIQRVWAWGMAVPRTAAYQTRLANQVRDLELTDVALMVNDLDDQVFNLTEARLTAIENMGRELRGAGADFHLVSWLRPNEAYMTAAADQLRGACERANARTLQFDVEEPWTRHTNEAGARSILERFWRFNDWPCLLGVTGITFIPAAVRPVVERCDYVVPQGYSVNRPGRFYQPGVTQTEAHRRWSGFGLPMVMGLAAYNLNRPGGISEAEAMRRAVLTTEALTGPAVSEIAYWSLEHLAQSTVRSDFVRETARKARAGLPQSATP